MQTYIVILQELGDTAFGTRLTIQLSVTIAKFWHGVYTEKNISLSSQFGGSRDAQFWQGLHDKWQIMECTQEQASDLSFLNQKQKEQEGRGFLFL